MKIQVLNDLHTEINRLFIAGSRFAKGDPRIQKYIPTLLKMGEKAPVMKKLAEKIEILVTAEQTESMNALAEAGTFLFAILATQGESTLDYEVIDTTQRITELPNTLVPYSKLQPVIEALTMSKQGRLEVIQTAYKEGIFQDFRLYEYLVDALGDRYSEIPEFLQNSVIPSIGTVMIPYLLEKYDPKGNKSSARRLALLGELGYEGAEKLAFEAIEESEQVYIAEGIKILGKNPENEGFLLTLTKDKKSATREVALSTLIKMSSEKGKEKVIEALSSNKYKAAIQPAKELTDDNYIDKVLEIVKEAHNILLSVYSKDNDFSKQEEHFKELFMTLENFTRDNVYEFYIDLLENSVYFTKPIKNGTYFRGNIVDFISNILHKHNTRKEIKIFERLCTKENLKRYPVLLERYYSLSLNFFDAKEMFGRFSEFYKEGLLESITMTGGYNYYYSNWDIEHVKRKISSDWLPLFEQKKDVLGLSYQLNSDNADSEEGKRIKKHIVDLLKDSKRKSKDRNQRMAQYQLLNFCNEEEKTEIKKILNI